MTRRGLAVFRREAKSPSRDTSNRRFSSPPAERRTQARNRGHPPRHVRRLECQGPLRLLREKGEHGRNRLVLLSSCPSTYLTHHLPCGVDTDWVESRKPKRSGQPCHSGVRPDSGRTIASRSAHHCRAGAAFVLAFSRDHQPWPSADDRRREADAVRVAESPRHGLDGVLRIRNSARRTRPCTCPWLVASSTPSRRASRARHDWSSRCSGLPGDPG